jgi:cytidyltransferase-like protein
LNDKRILGALLALDLQGEKRNAEAIAERLDSDVDKVESRLVELGRKGLLKQKGANAALTEQGRKAIKVVFIGGGFEVIHSGHLYTIEQARKLGDVLVVVVARDSTLRMGKGREPVATEVERVKLLSSLRQVDVAILGVEGDIYETLEKVKPDVVALGYDQRHAESDIAREAARRGIKLEVVRLDTPHPRIKTSRLLSEL